MVELLEQGSDERPVRRRWPWGVGVLAVAAVLLAGPGWSAWNDHQRHEIAHAWAMRAAYDDARSNALQKMAEHAVPGDDGVYAAAVRGLDREEAAHLRDLLSDLPRHLLRGSGGAMREAVAAALRAERQELLTPRPVNVGEQPLPAVTSTTLRLVDRATKLTGTTRASAPPQTAHAADAAIARFQHYLDTSVGGAQLLVDTTAGMQLLDIDASQNDSTPPYGLLPGQSPAVIAQPGWLVLTGDVMRAVDEDGSSHALPLGPYAVPGPTQSTVWTSDLRQAVLTNRQGQHVEGPVTLPTGTTGMVGAWGSDLVLRRQVGGSSDVVVWDTKRAVTTRLLPGDCGLAMTGKWLVSHSCNEFSTTVRLTNVDTGQQRLFDMGGQWVAYTGSFSPDGRWLALWLSSYYGEGTKLSMLDLRDGQLQDIRLSGTVGGGGPIAWSPDSQHAFVGSTWAQRQYIVMVGVSGGRSEVLRYYAPGLLPVAVLPR